MLCTLKIDEQRTIQLSYPKMQVAGAEICQSQIYIGKFPMKDFYPKAGEINWNGSRLFSSNGFYSCTEKKFSKLMNISNTSFNSYLVLQAQGFIKGKPMKISVLLTSPYYALSLWHCSWVRQLPLFTQEFIRTLCLCGGFVLQPQSLGLTWNLPSTKFLIVSALCIWHW